MAAINAIAREWADEIRDGIAWVIVWKTGRSWNAQAVWLNSDDDTFEPEDLELAREILEKDPKAVMVNGYYCGHFGEGMTVAELAAGIRWHYENGYNTLEDSTAFPPEPMECPADLPADLPWYGKATSAEPDPYVYDGYMSPEDFELMHKHMEADRQQQEKDTRAAPGASEPAQHGADTHDHTGHGRGYPERHRTGRAAFLPESRRGCKGGMGRTQKSGQGSGQDHGPTRWQVHGRHALPSKRQPEVVALLQARQKVPRAQEIPATTGAATLRQTAGRFHRIGGATV